MDPLSLKAYAKINIGLDITGKRKDGYHLLKTCMQTIGLYDEITVTADPKGQKEEIKITSDLCTDLADEENICFKAAALIKQEYGLKEKFLIDIKKNIPMAAGLAGGSADAAAVIEAADKICGLRLLPEQKDEIALCLGADVPFCLRRGLWLCEGIGEILTPLPALEGLVCVIIKPDFEVSTAWCYKAFDSLKENAHPDMDGALGALRKGNVKCFFEKSANVLEQAAGLKHPEIEEIKKRLLLQGALLSLMSGSGSSVFGLFDDRKKASEALGFFKSLSYVQDVFSAELVY